jgi:hypothetical protein
MGICRNCGNARTIDIECNLYNCKLTGRIISGNCECQTGQFATGTAETAHKAKKEPKYHNKHTWVDGLCFDSQMEADRYGQLKMLLRAGTIKGFCRQPEFVLMEGNEEQRAITYKADFIVFNLDGSVTVEDTKGYESEQWKRTYKMFKAKYPNIEISVLKEV